MEAHEEADSTSAIFLQQLTEGHCKGLIKSTKAGEWVGEGGEGEMGGGGGRGRGGN